MKIVSTFKHLEHTPALDQKIEEKSQKFKKFFDGNFEVIWTCSVQDDTKHLAEIKLLGPGFDFFASAHSDTLYKSLDLAVSKMEKQLHKKKQIRRDKIHHKHAPTVKDQFVAESEWDEQYWEDKKEQKVS